jgi:hypothetical protein
MFIIFIVASFRLAGIIVVPLLVFYGTYTMVLFLYITNN